MYKARYVPDRGSEIILGKESSIVFDLQEINGVSVNLNSGQQAVRIGENVLSSYIGGHAFSLSGVIYGENLPLGKDTIRKAFRPFGTGTLFFEEKYFMHVFVKTTPTFSPKKNDGRFVVQLFAPFPFFKKIDLKKYVFGSKNTFTIFNATGELSNNLVYDFYEGMTWADWKACNYNTDGYISSNNNLGYDIDVAYTGGNDLAGVVDSNGRIVTNEDIIIAGSGNYRLISIGDYVPPSSDNDDSDSTAPISTITVINDGDVATPFVFTAAPREYDTDAGFSVISLNNNSTGKSIRFNCSLEYGDKLTAYRDTDGIFKAEILKSDGTLINAISSVWEYSDLFDIDIGESAFDIGFNNSSGAPPAVTLEYNEIVGSVYES